MSDFDISDDSECLDSDEELQRALIEGRLKPGLNIAVAPPAKQINNVAGMKQKLEEIFLNFDWVERLDITSEPVLAPVGEVNANGGDLANNDFKRELQFYRQAQASVLIGLPRLKKLGIKTKRPEDYFAEMAKSDDHMKKIREKLLEKQQIIERRDKSRKLRELRKYGKKVQQEVLQKRQKDKREMLDAVKNFRKGQKNKLDFLDEKNENKKSAQKKDHTFHQPNKKRQFKNQKFGFGGQKKRNKMNSKEFAVDTSSDFSIKTNQGRPGFNKSKKAQKRGNKNKRPGKSQRHKMKSNR